ncbi:MAG: SHOCT domain-containing protein [Desulfatiglandaceae bacterium]|jgi:putative membrane protein
MTKKYLRIGGFSFFPMFFLALSSRMAFAYGGYGGGWGMGPGMMGGWGSGWWGFIPMLLFWGLIIVGVVFLIKLLAQGRTKGGSGDSDSSRALETLKERFARGEITKEEFGQMKKVIQT